MRTGRPREFDEKEALDRVMQAFQKFGYNGTNFEQLVADTGLSRSSLYNAFGGKDQLFEKSFALYIERELANFESKVIGEEGEEDDKLIGFIRYLTEPYVPGGQHCLLQQTLLENAIEGSAEPRQKHLVTTGLTKIWKTFAKAVRKVVPRKKKAAKITDNEKAAMLLAMMLGIVVIARNGRNEELVKSMASGAEKMIDLS